MNDLFSDKIAAINNKIENSYFRNLQNTKSYVEIQNHLFKFTSKGGKRIRAILVCISYELFGGKDNEEILKLSTFIEWIQTWLLIHDDIMDHDDQRRGGPTFHKIYENLAPEYNFSDRKDFGNTMAILAGDLASQYANQIIAQSNFKPDYKNKLLLHLSLMLQKVMEGQLLDIIIPKKDAYTEKDILQVMDYKTAKYTIELPMYAGAILAGTSDETLQDISRYAIPAGIAFQIRDDILGVFGDQEKTGKSSFSDLKEGKKTLLTLKAYENIDSKQKNVLDTYIGKNDLTDTQAEKVRKIIKDSGSLDYSLQKCKKYIQKAQKALEKLPKDNMQAWQFLYDLTEYLLIREV